MRILVTGGSGYIGSHAIRELARIGHDVVVYDDLSTGHRSLSEGFEFVEGDIGDKEKLGRSLRGVDQVMHFAASAYVGESVENPRKYFANNVEAALRFMDCLLAHSVRNLVFSSSCAVYGIPSVLPITEESAPDPINPYGTTKLFFERVLAAYAKPHELRYVALRYFNAAGADEEGRVGECHSPETHIVPLCIRAALRTGPPLRIFGDSFSTPDGTCVRDFIHVSDLARAHVRAAEYLEAGGEPVVMNLGTGRGTSLRMLVAEVSRVLGCEVPYTIEDPRPGDPPALYADPRRAFQLLQWEAQHDLEDIVRTACHWELSQTGQLAREQMETAGAV